MVEAQRRSGDAGAEAVPDRLGEAAIDAGIGVALEVAADLVAVVADPSGFARRGGVQQEARGLDRPGGEDDDLGPRLPPWVVPVEISHAGDLARVVGAD